MEFAGASTSGSGSGNGDKQSGNDDTKPGNDNEVLELFDEKVLVQLAQISKEPESYNPQRLDILVKQLYADRSAASVGRMIDRYNHQRLAANLYSGNTDTTNERTFMEYIGGTNPKRKLQLIERVFTNYNAEEIGKKIDEIGKEMLKCNERVQQIDEEIDELRAKKPKISPGK